MNLTWAAATLPPLLAELGCVGGVAIAADKERGSIVVADSSLVVNSIAGNRQNATVVAALFHASSKSDLLIAVRPETADMNATVRFGGPLLHGFTSATRIRLSTVESSHDIVDGGFTDQLGALDVAIYQLARAN